MKPSECQHYVRFSHAERYLQLVSEGLRGPWERLARRALGNRDLPLALSLIHPGTVPDRAGFQRGSRGFTMQKPKVDQRCESVRFWGVDCQLHVDALHADHDWPWSLGGPTHQGNLTWLCSYHNLCKGSDIHCWPWERPDFPAWLEGALSPSTGLR